MRSRHSAPVTAAREVADRHLSESDTTSPGHRRVTELPGLGWAPVELSAGLPVSESLPRRRLRDSTILPVTTTILPARFARPQTLTGSRPTVTAAPLRRASCPECRARPGSSVNHTEPCPSVVGRDRPRRRVVALDGPSSLIYPAVYSQASEPLPPTGCRSLNRHKRRLREMTSRRWETNERRRGRMEKGLMDGEWQRCHTLHTIQASIHRSPRRLTECLVGVT